MVVSLNRVQNKYNRITENDKSEKNEISTAEFSLFRLTKFSWAQVLCCVAIPIVAATMGYLVGLYDQSFRKTPDLGARTTLQTFNYNLTFAEAPSARTNAAWDALLPTNGGIIKNPTGGTERTGLSIFHQLHCLDILRRVYYIAALGLEPDNTIEHPHRHARHCFDFLRQSLMCAGDITVEFEDATRGGITGIGATHRCANYNEIVAWTETQGDAV